MHNTKGIELLASQIELCKNSRKSHITWVLGLSGAGKPFLVGQLSSILRRRWTVAACLSDRNFVLPGFLLIMSSYTMLGWMH